MARKHSRSRSSNRRASRSNPSASDGLIVAGVALGTAGLVLWWASRGQEAAAATLPADSSLPTAPTPARPLSQNPRSGGRAVPVGTAVLRARFHLRPAVSLAANGPTFPARTRVSLLDRMGLRRGRSTLWRVRVADGREGYVFVNPEEIQLQ